MAASLIICNWKMYLSYQEAVHWVKTNTQELKELLYHKPHRLVVCPSYDVLGALKDALPAPHVFLGAQDCAAHLNGPYTGQVSARSLKELGCAYTIIGHSETRKNLKGTIEASALKTKCAFDQDITPVVCIGESEDKYKAGTSLKLLEEQMRPLLALSLRYSQKQLVIAYEPLWSIGTGIVPENAYLEEVFAYIAKRSQKMGLQRAPLLLYGGSVDETNAATLKAVPLLSGFLIGKASTDFQKLKKIVQLI